MPLLAAISAPIGIACRRIDAPPRPGGISIAAAPVMLTRGGRDGRSECTVASTFGVRETAVATQQAGDTQAVRPRPARKHQNSQEQQRRPQQAAMAEPEARGTQFGGG